MNYCRVSCSETAYKGKVFIFKKLQGPLKGIIFSENLQNPSLYIKEQSPIIKFEIKSCLIFLKFPKIAKTVFDLKNSKTKFLPPFSSVFAFKQAKEQILFQVKT